MFGCNPLTGLFFLRHKLTRATWRMAGLVAIPLRGFSFCDALTVLTHHVILDIELQSPYGAFLFATRSTGGVQRRYSQAVAIPLRGFSFCDMLTSSWKTFKKKGLQSPYGAFLFATVVALVGGALALTSSCNPLTGLFFLRLSI